MSAVSGCQLMGMGWLKVAHSLFVMSTIGAVIDNTTADIASVVKQTVVFWRAMVYDESALDDIVQSAILAYLSGKNFKSATRREWNFICWKRGKHGQYSRDPFPEEVQYDFDPLEEIIKSEKTRQLQRAISQLPPRPRRIFELTYIDGLSRDEVAQRLGMKKTNVVARLSDHRHVVIENLARRDMS